MQNVSPNDFAMWAYDAAANVWEELKPNGGKTISELWSAKLAPGGGHQMAYSSKHRKLVAVQGKETWVYDLTKNEWSHLATVEDHGAHDPTTTFAYDSANDLFLLVNAPEGRWKHKRDLRALDLTTGRWRKIETTGEPLDTRPYHGNVSYYDTDRNVLVLYDGGIRVVRVGKPAGK